MVVSSAAGNHSDLKPKSNTTVPREQSPITAPCGGGRGPTAAAVVLFICLFLMNALIQRALGDIRDAEIHEKTGKIYELQLKLPQPAWRRFPSGTEALLALIALQSPNIQRNMKEGRDERRSPQLPKTYQH